MDVDCASREEAVSQLKTIMSESALEAHMKEKHPVQPMIPLSQVHAMIEQELVAV